MKKLVGVLMVLLLLAGCTGSIVESQNAKIQGQQGKQKVETGKSEATAASNTEKTVVQQTDTAGKGQTAQRSTAENTIISEEENRAEAIDNYMAGLSLEEKVGQLLMAAVRKDERGNNVTQINEEMKRMLRQYHVGGIILFGENVEEPAQVKKLIDDMQQEAEIPLFIGVDEEGGSVSRIGSRPEFTSVPFKEAFALGKTHDPSRAYKEAARMGNLLYELGFNMDFAPDADIFNEPSNTVIGRRSFGMDAETVTPMVIAFSKGLRKQGILAVVKHFPGHGCTRQDSHTGLAYVDKPLDQLEAQEMVPFLEAVKEGADGLMKGHLIVPAVDKDYPASLSKKWQDYLEAKTDLSHTLLITDALNMGAVTKKYGSGEAAVLGIEAGDDVLLMPEDLEEAYQGILAAVQKGRISEKRIDVSVRKILSKKIAHNLMVLS